MGIATEFVDLVLHHGLPKAKYQNSKLILTQPSDRPHGAVFLTRTKDALRQAKGFVCTSEEAVLENQSASHWTPNIFRYGTYADQKRKIVKGHEESNLKQINTLVVDADFGDHKPNYDHQLLLKFVVQPKDIFANQIFPAAVLETPHGYQAYYVLDTPVFIAKKGNRYPAVEAAKLTSEMLRNAVKGALPNVDLGANHFGFFRLPDDDDIRFFEPALTCSFSDLYDWAKQVASESRSQAREKTAFTDPTKQPWFDALTRVQVPRGDGQLGRNNTLLTLLLACYAAGWGKDRTYDYADEWNSRQKQALQDREVRAILKSAFSGKYAGPKRQYIDQLVAAYTPKLKQAHRYAGHGWVKQAKPRADRKYSHYREWAKDLVALVARRAGVATELSLTTTDIRKALGLSRESLNHVLDLIEATSMLQMRRVRGRGGRLIMATFTMAGRRIQAAKRAKKEQWQSYLGDVGRSEEAPMMTGVFVPLGQPILDG
ncbi:primase C-terminal domain-containing protein [Lacticaseibacillus sp. 53-4]|uniref:primase C-terminal domain-containing protein n=1 Tax=Lacticaseibacillus sp. 53-4 TaxID=2799575 RepID=UPI00194447A2|nr:primase C-terminal domain-containing protein [Lacticaseibacillus sp. 53-4]